MRELNEQELEQVAGGFSFNYGTQAQSTGTAVAGFGSAVSRSVTNSTYTPGFSDSFAANKSIAWGSVVGATSSAASTSGITVSS
jgi:hypothetical protein